MPGHAIMLEMLIKIIEKKWHGGINATLDGFTHTTIALM